MADGVEVGHGYITINASAKGAVQQINREFGRNMPAAGRKAGAGLGVGMAAGMSKAFKPLLALFAVAKVGGFFKEANTEARDAEKVGKVTEQRIKTTGGAAKISAKQVEELATAISNKAGMDDELIQKGANLLLTFKNVRNEAGEGANIFDRATGSAADLAASGFGTVESSSKMLGKALNDPMKGLTALGRAGVTFTDDQKKQIKELVKTGDVLGAQKVILKEVESQVGGTAEASTTAAEKSRVGWDNLKEQIGTALLPVIDKFFGFLTTTGIPALSKLVTWIGGLGAKFNGAKGSVSSFSPALAGVIKAGRELGAVVLPIIRELAAAFLKEWPKIKPLVMDIFRAIGGIVSDVLGLMKFRITVVTKAISFIWSKWGKYIKIIGGDAFRSTLKIIKGVLQILGGVIKVFTGVMTGDWRKAGEGIKQICRGLLTALTAVWGTIGKRLKEATKILMDNLRGRFRDGVNKIGAAWDKLKEKAKAPVKFVINTVINDGLIGAFNKIAGAVGASKLSRISVPGFHAGGWTGPGSKMKPAGIVHADEFVINKGSRRRIEQDAPGLLNRLNGYASGGRVGYKGGTFTARFAQHLRAAEKLAGVGMRIFQGGFRPATSYSGTSHRGDAVDVQVNRALLVAMRKVGIATWDRTGKGNWAPHMHGVPLPGHGSAGGSAVWQAQDYRRGGDGLGGRDNGPNVGVLGKIAGVIKSGFNTVKDWLSSLFKGPLGKLKDITGSPIGALAARFPRLIADAMLNKVKGFGAGGITTPGWSMVGERGRELMLTPGGSRIYSNRQTEQMMGSPRPIQVSNHFPINGSVEAAVAASQGLTLARLAAKGI